MNIETLVSSFKENFTSQPFLYRAPGRINLIGEHTDYNLGYVLPAAIDKAMYFAVGRRKDDIISIIAHDLGEQIQWKLGEKPTKTDGWVAYLYGMVEIIRQAGHTISGFDCVFGGDIPIGAGVSSSAALECGMGHAIRTVMKLEISDWELTQMAQRTEHEYVGLKCGIMDMFASVHGRKNQVIRLDCRSMEYTYFPFKLDDYAIVLCDTGVSHNLASTEYNTRREQCEEGVRIIGKTYPSTKSLRDVSQEILEEHKHKMDPVIYQRCKFIVEENERVLALCQVLESGKVDGVGAYIYASHEGLQNDYEVSCAELDFLVEQTRDKNYVLGARMMGGGFGGCTINLVKKADLPTFSLTMKEAYRSFRNRDLPIHIMHPDEGVGSLEMNQIG